MDGTQFMVQWDEHPSHLATRLGYLLEHQSLVDVTLMCNTHTLKVHKAVLAACSPYFERQLGNHPLIVLKDMKFSVLKSLVEFMYCGETSVSEENLSPLLEAAKFFEVKGLSTMTKETVCTPSTSPGVKTCNGTSISSGFSRGGGRGRGRGRGRPPLNQPSTSSSKIGSPTESAQILLSLSGNSPSPQLLNTKTILNDGKIPPKLTYEPRRRGRKRGALNTAFRDKLLREVDTQMTIENLKRDLTEDGDPTSPLLSSLLTKPEKLNSTLNDKKSPYIIKALQKGEEKTKESLNEEMIMTLKNGAETEAEVEPEAVVLFEVRDNKKVDKHVVSAKDISLLKSLNEQLTNQKKELGDLMASLNLVDNDVNVSDQIEDLKLKILKTKQMLSQLVGYSKDKIVEKKSQMVQLEFLDGNGEKIEGYQVQGTFVDKKESKDEFLGLFDICDNQNQSPLLAAENVAVDKEKLDQAYQLEDNAENISYEIEAMMNDSSNIVIEDKNQDYKYIIDNDGTMMNQEDNYVVYESVETGNVIYDGGQGVLTDIGEGSGEDYVVSDNQVIEDSTEYIVYDKPAMNDISEQQEYIMYNDEKQQENLVIYSSTDRLEVKEEVLPLDELSQEENCIPNKFSMSNFHSGHKYRKSDMKRRSSSASDSSNSSMGKKLRPDPTLAQGEESL